jgi:hypothetical protein
MTIGSFAELWTAVNPTVGTSVVMRKYAASVWWECVLDTVELRIQAVGLSEVN